MYLTEVEAQTFAFKPMNCPGRPWSTARACAPIATCPCAAEFGLCHRYEKSGVLTGMMRVRSFTQDDAHIYCARSRSRERCGPCCASSSASTATWAWPTSGSSSHPAPRLHGQRRDVGEGERALAQALAAENVDYKVNPGDGAFYGPKVDFHVRDSLKRSWQMSTVQLDFQIPERFELSYVSADGSKQRP